MFTGFEENDYLRNLYQINDELKKQIIGKTSNDGSGALLFSPNVVFNIHLSREEIYNLYRDADVFVSTSLSENSPIVHREAATCGMPVISLDVGDVRTMDGVIIVSDEQELAETMKRLSEDRTLLYSYANIRLFTKDVKKYKSQKRK